MSHLNPEQKILAAKSLDEIMAAAEAVPAPVKPRVVEDMIPIIRKLRDEKKLSWPDISHWMRDNTEFYRSSTFWNQLYKGKRQKLVGITEDVQ